MNRMDEKEKETHSELPERNAGNAGWLSPVSAANKHTNSIYHSKNYIMYKNA